VFCWQIVKGIHVLAVVTDVVPMIFWHEIFGGKFLGRKFWLKIAVD
jgi:hypothetical protein